MGQNLNYTQAYFNFDIKNIVNQIDNSKKDYDYVVGIKRGGLIPAVCISHILGLPMYSLDWSNRDYPEKNDYQKVLQSNSKILLIDDICDTGETLIRIKELYNFSNIDTAVLLYNEDQIHIPTYWARKFSRKIEPDWVQFWWEDINNNVT